MTIDHGHHEPPWSVAANDRDEHRSASRLAPEWREPRRVGSAWVDEPDLPDWDEPA